MTDKQFVDVAYPETGARVQFRITREGDSYYLSLGETYLEPGVLDEAISILQDIRKKEQAQLKGQDDER